MAQTPNARWHRVGEVVARRCNHVAPHDKWNFIHGTTWDRNMSYLPGQRQARRDEHARPVDGVEAEDVLAYDVHAGRPAGGREARGVGALRQQAAEVSFGGEGVRSGRLTPHQSSCEAWMRL